MPVVELTSEEIVLSSFSVDIYPGMDRLVFRKRDEPMIQTDKFVAIDPQDGSLLRDATESEIEAYRQGNSGRKGAFASSAFDRPKRVGEVLIDRYTGPGQWHIPGRFLS